MRVVTLPESPATMSLTVVRRWESVVLLADPSLGKVAEEFIDDGGMVSATKEGVVWSVFAGGELDDWEEEEDSWEFRTVTLHVGIGTSPIVRGTAERVVVFDGVIATPSAMVAVSDGASPGFQLPVWPEQTRVVIATVEGETLDPPREVWLDLLPV